MNSIFTVRTMLTIIGRAWMAASLVCIAQPVFGQFEGSFHGLAEPIRDSAVTPADFQHGRQDFTNRLEAASDPMDLPGDAELFDNDVDSGHGKDSLVEGFKNQFNDLDLPRMFGSLAIVLGGYFGLVWLTRRFGGRGSGRLPSEVVEVLGQTPFKPGHNLQLIRLGNKLLLLINGPEGTHTIGEISDPQEVARLCTACGVSKPNIRPAASHFPASPPAASPTQGPNTDLKQILRQLQRVADDPRNGAVFEA